MTYEQKLRAAVLLFQTVEREVTALPLSSVFSPLLLLCFPFFLFFSVCFFFHLPFLFLFQSRPSHFSLTVPLPCFKLPRLLFFFSLSSPLFSFLSVFSSLFFFFLPLFFLCWRWVVFIGQRGAGASLSLCMGSGVFLPCHDAGLSGQWVWIVGHDPRGSHQWGGVSTRGRNKWERQKFLSSLAAHLGEEGGGTVSLKTTLFCSFFFYMKRRRFEQNAPFHLNKIWRQNTSTPKLVLNLFFVHSRPQMQFWF